MLLILNLALCRAGSGDISDETDETDRSDSKGHADSSICELDGNVAGKSCSGINFEFSTHLFLLVAKEEQSLSSLLPY